MYIIVKVKENSMTSVTPEFIREEILSQNYEIIEEYPNDPRGESCLVLGFTNEKRPIHVVCGKNRSGHLILITIYTPEMPKWKDPYTRNRKD